jgi:hypothetical protein
MLREKQDAGHPPPVEIAAAGRPVFPSTAGEPSSLDSLPSFYLAPAPP